MKRKSQYVEGRVNQGRGPGPRVGLFGFIGKPPQLGLKPGLALPAGDGLGTNPKLASRISDGAAGDEGAGC